MQSRRVLIVDDHALVAKILTDTLALSGYETRAAVLSSDADVLVAVDDFRPGVVLLDLDLGQRRSGLTLIEPIVATGARVLMLTASTHPLRLAECIEAGAVGLLSKGANVEDVVQALEAVMTRGTAISEKDRAHLLEHLVRERQRHEADAAPFARLTRREGEVLGALVQGKTAQVIAEDTHTSVRTVRGHIQAVLDKLGVHSQLEAVAQAKARRWRPRPHGRVSGRSNHGS